ncbi:MAG TPA: hypothetical protein VFZ34_17750 [Blastocatellia bacterium]|nr:hypothetical protein [Blastocatellia bacterium]
MKQRFSLWLSLLGLLGLTAMVSAQTTATSLVYTDATSGQRFEFTAFGTLVYQPQNLVSAGWQVKYKDPSGSHTAYYFNRQLNSGVEAVALTANFPTGQVLNKGDRLYVHAVMRTTDGKLRITKRFIWDVGQGPISSVLTYENTSSSPVEVDDVIIWRLPKPPLRLPPPPGPPGGRPCPYIPPLEPASVSTLLVNIGGVRYVQTVISYAAAPPLQPSQSRDEPTGGADGCDG